MNSRRLIRFVLTPRKEANTMRAEVGFGNGKVVPRLMGLASAIAYTGIDYSQAMVAEAKASNKSQIEGGSVEFRRASVEAIPFADDSFDHALTINTIYFWPEPVRGLAEIRRVLRPSGNLLLVVGTPEQMARNAFTQHGFRLYADAQLRELFVRAGFREVTVELYRDQAPTLDRSKNNLIERSRSYGQQMAVDLANPQCISNAMSAALSPRS